MKKLLTALLFVAPLLLMAQPPKEKKEFKTTIVELKDAPVNNDAPPPPPPPPMEDADDDIIALPATDTPRDVFTVVENMPKYTGGEDSLLAYLRRSIKYPNKAKDAGTQGTAYIQFIVNANGSISDALVLRGLNGPGAKECDAEALRVIREMPNWVPGTQNGKNVRVQYILPIKFMLR